MLSNALLEICETHPLLLLTAAPTVTKSVAYTAAIAEGDPGTAPGFQLLVSPQQML